MGKVLEFCSAENSPYKKSFPAVCFLSVYITRLQKLFELKQRCLTITFNYGVAA